MKKAFLFDANSDSKKAALKWCAKHHADLIELDSDALASDLLMAGSFVLIDRLKRLTRQELMDAVSFFEHLHNN